MGPDIFGQILIFFETLTSTLNMTDTFSIPAAISNNNLSFTTSTYPQCCRFDPYTEFSHCDFVHDDANLTVGIRKEPDWRHPITGIFPTATSKIMFEVRRPKCHKGENSITINYAHFDGSRDGHFLENGYFGYKDDYYSPFEYCINGMTDESMEIVACNPECSRKNPCIRKCCRPNEIYSFQQRGCVESTTKFFKPHFYHDMKNKLSEAEIQEVHPHYIVNFPRSFRYNCELNRTQFFPAGLKFAQYLSNFTGRPFEKADFRVKTDGSIIYRKNDDIEGTKNSEGKVINRIARARKCNKLMTEHYCLEGAVGYGNPNPFSNDEEEVFLATCARNLLQTPTIGPLSFLYGNTMICSSFFSLLTVVVYLALKEKQNIHGWLIISYASSMFFMYNFLGMAHLIRYYASNDVLKTNVCTIIGIGSHFFSLSSFLWLTVINYDLWWTFRAIRPSSEDQMKLWRHYFQYCLFGWGVPVVIIIASLTIHFKHEDAAEYDCSEVGFYLPAYGRESCEIKQKALGVYLYYPASALLICNLLCFVMTTYKLCKHEKTTSVATRTTDRNPKQSFQIFAKLFFVMGVTRVFEVLSWAESGPTLTWYWAVFDIFNFLQAVAIFIIFVCKRDVIESLKKRFPTLKMALEKLHFCKTTGMTRRSLLKNKIGMYKGQRILTQDGPDKEV